MIDWCKRAAWLAKCERPDALESATLSTQPDRESNQQNLAIVRRAFGMAVDQIGANPFGILTFIVAPAILTNASSVMSLGTSNRFARAIDRARALAKELQAPPAPADDAAALRVKQLVYANRRALLLGRPLPASSPSPTGSTAA